MGTNPLRADIDGDGQIDSEDPDPLSAPTPEQGCCSVAGHSDGPRGRVGWLVALLVAVVAVRRRARTRLDP
jgi:MYXO-CTERM domain-containing protein